MCRTQCALALVVLCVGLAHSWDIAIASGDLLEFYTNVTRTVTVRFNSQNLAALAYDEVHNMMLYVDKQSNNDAICGYDISSMQYKYLTERNGRNIQSLAFDPATELLFFTDTRERSINWISLKPESKNTLNGSIVIKMDDGIPTEIAVDSCKGYIYWINTNLTTPTIERARFNGSDREVVIKSNLLSIDTTNTLEPHSLVIDQPTQKMYWIEPKTSILHHIYQADLNGRNKEDVIYINNFPNVRVSNRLTVSKKSLFLASWLTDHDVWGYPKTDLGLRNGKSYKSLFKMNNMPTSMVANYKVSEQMQGIRDCKALTSPTEYDGPFCVHGVKVNGQSLCKCTPGYTGERCDVSVCANYCIQGSCSFSNEGLPTCRCNVGYSGERCEVNACYGYCLNNGDCSLNEKSEPVCQCKEDYVGDRCDVSECLNYCIHGNCSFDDEGIPTCRCNAGYTGERCEVNACDGYCLNNGNCSLNEEDEPFCECVGNHEGSRCEAVKNDTITCSIAQGNLTLTDIFSKSQKPISKVSVNVEYL